MSVCTGYSPSHNVTVESFWVACKWQPDFHYFFCVFPVFCFHVWLFILSGRNTESRRNMDILLGGYHIFLHTLNKFLLYFRSAVSGLPSPSYKKMIHSIQCSLTWIWQFNEKEKKGPFLWCWNHLEWFQRDFWRSGELVIGNLFGASAFRATGALPARRARTFWGETGHPDAILKRFPWGLKPRPRRQESARSWAAATPSPRVVSLPVGRKKRAADALGREDPPVWSPWWVLLVALLNFQSRTCWWNKACRSISLWVRGHLSVPCPKTSLILSYFRISLRSLFFIYPFTFVCMCVTKTKSFSLTLGTSLTLPVLK